MQRMIFVNLPVRDLARATNFYQSMGFTKNDQFSNDDAACMALSETIIVMLHTPEHFMRFSPKPIADSSKVCEVLLCVSEESRAAVDGFVDKAISAGGVVDPCPRQDYGFMYGRSFEDPDGHIWEVMWMDPAAVERGCAENAAMAEAETA